MRKAQLVFAVFTVVLVFCQTTLASGSLSPVHAASVQELVLGKYLYSLEDAEGTLLLEDMNSPVVQQRFEPVFFEQPYLGRTRSTFWFRFDIDFSQRSQPLILEIGYPHLKHITFYRFQGEQLLEQLQSGYGATDQPDLGCSRFCFSIESHPGIQTVFLRISSDSPLFLPMMLRTPELQLRNERSFMAIQALFYGAFLVMGLFNLFLYTSTKEKSYLYYVAYIAALSIWTLSHDGLLRELLLREHAWLASYKFHFILTLLSVAVGALFCQQFLKTKTSFPFHHRIFSFLILCSLIVTLLVIINNRIVLPNSANLLTLLACLTAISSAIIGFVKGIKTARYFLIAWCSVIVGSVGWVLTISGIFPLNKFTAFSVHIGALLETILLALALGDRINVLQRDSIRLQKKANRALELSNKKLAASNQFKNEFLSTVSHELRTPMNGIFGASELLENTVLNTEQTKYLSTITRSSRDMMGMVENILTYSQLEAGIATATLLPFKFRDCIEEIGFYYRGRAAIQNLDFKFELDPDVPVDLEGDEDKLRLLLDHILDNAYKFTDKGLVEFKIRTIKESNSKLQIEFTITDTGCGVPESLQAEIVDSFKQADGSLTRRKGGLAIGLALSQKIVNILKGKLEFSSSLGRGTTVRLVLPFTSCSESITADLNTISETIDPENADILVVEDNYVNKLVMEGQLKSLGFNVYSAGNGREAVSLMEKRNYDLVFMDCQMPIMDGLECTKQIRQLKNHNSAVPIIAVTANTNPGDREACISSGMNDYIKKPFNQATLVQAINRWLGYSNPNDSAISRRA